MISFTLAIEALEGHGPGIGEARHLSQGRQDLVRDRLIYRYRHRGGGAGGGAPDGHVADVDPVLAQDSSDPADHAGHILVANERRVLLRHDVHRKAKGVDNTWLHPGTEQGPAHDALPPVPRAQSQGDEVSIVRAIGDTGGLYLHSSLFSQSGRVHEVQRLVDHRGEEPLDHRYVQQTRVEAGDLTPILDLQRAAGPVRELIKHPPERLAQLRELSDELSP